MMKRIYVNLMGDEKKSAKGYILDISSTGIGIAASLKIREMTVVDIVFDLPGFSVFKGKVVNISNRNSRSYNRRLGIEFVSLNKKRKYFLNKLINQYLRKIRTI